MSEIKIDNAGIKLRMSETFLKMSENQVKTL